MTLHEPVLSNDLLRRLSNVPVITIGKLGSSTRLSKTTDGPRT
jgi:hypothetical protein